MVAEGGADALVLARPAQVGRAAASRDDGPATSHQEVLDAALGVGQRVVAVAGAIAVGERLAVGARGVTGGIASNRRASSWSASRSSSLIVAIVSKPPDASTQGRPDGWMAPADGATIVKPPSPRVSMSTLVPVSGLRGHLLGRRGPGREHRVGPRPGHVHLPVDATTWGPLLVAGPDALDEGSRARPRWRRR